MQSPVCAILVTYHCGDRIRTALAALRAQAVDVVVVDNGSDRATIAILEEYAGEMHLIRNAENRGLAAAQNQGIRHAITHGYDWVLLLDDDSLPDAAMIPTMLSAYARAGDIHVGIVAPRYVEQNVDLPSRYLVPRGRFWFGRKAVHAHEMRMDVLTVIASGSLIRTEIFAKTGLMAEGFFIDYVDHEFCLRLRRHGYHILVVGDAVLNHRQGNKSPHHLAGVAVVTANYSPVRRYYMFRNRMFFLRLNARTYPFLLPYELLACAWDMVRIIALEPDKMAKLRSALRGLLHGLIKPVPAVPTVSP